LVLPRSRARIVRCGGRYDPQLVKRSSEWVSAATWRTNMKQAPHGLRWRGLECLTQLSEYRLTDRYACVLCTSTIDCKYKLTHLTGFTVCMAFSGFLLSTVHSLVCCPLCFLVFPRDAMHSAVDYAVARCMFVRLSVCHTPLLYRNG